MKKAILILFVSVLVISCRDEEPYGLGFLASLTGENADLGEAGRNGFLLAVEEQNNAGGIGGREIATHIKDGQMDPDLVVREFNALKDEKVEVVIGPFTSSQTKAVLTASGNNDLLIFSPTASSMDFVDQDDMLIRANSTTRDNTQYYADYLIKNAGLRSVGILYDLNNQSFTLSWFEEFSNSYQELGGEILYSEGINSRQSTDFRAPLNNMLAVKPDCLLLIANSIDSASIVQRLRQMDPDIPVVVSEWAGTIQFIEMGGRSVNGVVVLQSFDPFDQGESFQSFKKRFLERFHTEPTFASVMTYDATRIVLKALEMKEDKESLKESVLRNGPYQGLQETIILNEFGDARRNAVFSIVKDGRFRKIE